MGAKGPALSPIEVLRFRALFDHLPFAIRVFDTGGRTVAINRAYTELWGVTAEQLSNGGDDILADERFAAAGITPYLRRGFQGEVAVVPPIRYTADEIPTIRGRRTHWIQTLILPIKDETGALREVMALLEDVTERIESYETLEQRVAERTHELTTLLDVSHTVSSTLDLKGLLRLILDQLRAIVEYTGATIYTIENREFKILDYHGPLPPAHVAQLRYPLSRMQNIWDAFANREPVLIDDVRGESPHAREYQQRAGDNLTTTLGYIRAWMGVPLMLKQHVIGALTLTSSQPGHFTEQHARLALGIADQAAIAIENAKLFEQAQGLAALVERQRLARELHDSVSQALYGIALGARTARTLLDRSPARAIEPVEYVLSLAEAGLAEMRALIFELRPESLEAEGLVAALSKQADSLRARHQIQVDTDFCAEPALSLAAKEALYRVAQEALHNTVKHARATRASLRLAAEDGRAVLTVADNGAGFNPGGSFPGHLGLRSMRERMERISGELAIASQPGAGAEIRAAAPLEPAEP
ncbi:MAG TPA: histidine kinase [Herpetosiphonaceae bacterium]